MLNKKIDFYKAKQGIKKAPFFVAKYDFFVFIICTLIIIGLIFFYYWRYDKKTERSTVVSSSKVLRINNKLYSQFLKESQKRQKEFWQATTENYPEVFAPLTGKKKH